ncbi:unnamed protein product [Tuber aestivum]|uniref:Uncharacterized protein n=1 Tax=Tuber aestivum TaxID=59557 RepID=A0A292Q0K0_9PEZI|nr:unnamed protein product [Tuber aestivum]
MHLRSGKKTIFTPAPPRKRSPGRRKDSPRAGEITVNTGRATAALRPPPELITPPYTPVTTTRPDLETRPGPPPNDWSDLEVVFDHGPQTDSWDGAGMLDIALGLGLSVCGAGSGGRRRRAVSWKSILLLWGSAVMVFGFLYVRESGGVGERVWGGYEGAYEGLYLCEWGLLLLQLFRNRGEISMGA